MDQINELLRGLIAAKGEWISSEKSVLGGGGKSKICNNRRVLLGHERMQNMGFYQFGMGIAAFTDLGLQLSVVPNFFFGRLQTSSYYTIQTNLFVGLLMA